MAIAAEKNEVEVLRALRSRYERDGYTFVIHPTEDLIPEFLRGYRPDALALSDHGSIVIEVKSQRSRDAEKGLSQLAKQIAKHAEWKLDVYYAGNFSRPVYDKPTKSDVLKLIDEVQKLERTGHRRAAIVMAWAALEALARALHPDAEEGVRPMIPSEIIEWLAQSGYIIPAEARLLKSTMKTRNATVHGVSNVEVAPHEISILHTTLESLAAQLDDAR